ncbi:WD40-repeat-containing domain protein [Trametes meyenii]|nr:WD40-repeat-containing domain protein [Trametes meyenii]
MTLRYTEYGRLTNGHEKGITKVAFSPEGNYVATAGLDGRICVWDVSSRDLLYSFDGSSPVLSLAWLPRNEDIILCSLQDGNMAILRIAPNCISVTGFWAHSYPVECLAIRNGDTCLASGAHCELLVWVWDEQSEKFCLEHEISQPSKRTWNEAQEILVTSIHCAPESTSRHVHVSWTTARRCNQLDSPSYYSPAWADVGLSHVEVRFHCLTPCSAGASLSQDGMCIAVYNTSYSFNVFSMRTGAPLGAIEREGRSEVYPLPVLFIHGSLALLIGSTTGDINVWDVLDTITEGPQLNVPETEEARAQVLHTLSIPRRAKALAIDAFYNNQHDEFFIATGIMNESAPSACILWKASEYTNVAQTRTRTLRSWHFSRQLVGIVSLAALASAIVLAMLWASIEEGEGASAVELD